MYNIFIKVSSKGIERPLKASIATYAQVSPNLFVLSLFTNIQSAGNKIQKFSPHQ